MLAGIERQVYGTAGDLQLLSPRANQLVGGEQIRRAVLSDGRGTFQDGEDFRLLRGDKNGGGDDYGKSDQLFHLELPEWNSVFSCGSVYRERLV